MGGGVCLNMLAISCDRVCSCVSVLACVRP